MVAILTSGPSSAWAPLVCHFAPRADGIRSVLIAEGGVEGLRRQVPEERADVAHRLLRTVQPVHPGILPLDRDGAGVADRAQRPERILPGNVPMTGRDEVPAAS